VQIGYGRFAAECLASRCRADGVRSTGSQPPIWPARGRGLSSHCRGRVQARDRLFGQPAAEARVALPWPRPGSRLRPFFASRSWGRFLEHTYGHTYGGNSGPVGGQHFTFKSGPKKRGTFANEKAGTKKGYE